MFWTGGGADDTNPPGRLPPNNTPLSVRLPEYVWDRSPGHEITNVTNHRLLKCQVKENCSHVKLSLHIKTVSSMASYPLTSESFPGARLIVAPRLPLIFDSHLCLSFLPLASHFSSLPLIFTSHLCLLPLPLIFASCLLSLSLIFDSHLCLLPLISHLGPNHSTPHQEIPPPRLDKKWEREICVNLILAITLTRASEPQSDIWAETNYLLLPAGH